MVEPVKYTRDNVILVNEGDVIPEKSVIFCQSGERKWSGVFDRSMTAGPAVKYYAPAPILDLPPEPQEVEFGEAMRRIKDGDRIGWKRGADLGQVVYLRGGNLMVSRPLMPDTYVTNFGVLVEGTFYEIPETTEPQPKTTGLKWWEAIEAVRGTGKWVRYAGLTGDPCDCWAKWNKSGVLVSGLREEFVVTLEDLDAEWEIVE